MDNNQAQQENINILCEELRLAYQSLLNNVLISNKLLSQETEEDDILSLLLSITRLIIDFDAGAVFKYEGNVYNQVASMDINDTFQTIKENYLKEGIYSWAAEQKRTLVMPEGSNVTHILVPMSTEKTSIGILDLQVAWDADLIKNQDLDLLWVVAMNAASKCEQIKLNRWSGLVDILLSTLEKINSSEQMDMLFEVILKGLNQILFASRYLLLIDDNDKLKIKSRYDDGENYCILSAYKKKHKCTFVNKAITEKESVKIPHLNESSECNDCPHLLQRPTSETYLMIVPLIIEGSKNCGAITIVDNSYNSNLFKDDSLYIAQIFAKQVTIAIHQTQLRDELRKNNAKITKEIKMAGIVQQSLLPEIMRDLELTNGAKINLHIDNDLLTVTGFYLPCLSLGGDFYDIIDINGSITFTIADVSGHGLSSSLITALFKMSLHKFVTDQNIYSTNQICSLLNMDLCKFIKTGDYITSFISFFDLETRNLHYSSAGHPYPIYLNKKENKIHTLQANGLPLALVENQIYPAGSITLNPGDKLLFYTDGITEATNRNIGMYKSSNLIKSFYNNSELSATNLMTKLYQDLLNFKDEKIFSDDITMLLIEMKNID